jgi:hypothetical protein
MELLKPNRFVRQAIWAGGHKVAFLALFAAIHALLGGAIVAFSVGLTYGGLIALVTISMFCFGLVVGWFMYGLFIWPVYAAFPGSTILPPHIKVYADRDHAKREPKQPTDAV